MQRKLQLVQRTLALATHCRFTGEMNGPANEADEGSKPHAADDQPYSTPSIRSGHCLLLSTAPTDKDPHPNACAILATMPIGVKHLERDFLPRRLGSNSAYGNRSFST